MIKLAHYRHLGLVFLCCWSSLLVFGQRSVPFNYMTNLEDGGQGTLAYSITNKDGVSIGNDGFIRFAGQEKGKIEIRFNKLKEVPAKLCKDLGFKIHASRFNISGDIIEQPRWEQGKFYQFDENGFVAKGPILELDVVKNGKGSITITLVPAYKGKAFKTASDYTPTRIKFSLTIAGLKEAPNKGEVVEDNVEPLPSDISDLEICALYSAGKLDKRNEAQAKDRLKVIDNQLWNAIAVPESNASRDQWYAYKLALEEYLRHFPDCKPLHRHIYKSKAREELKKAEESLSEGIEEEQPGPEEERWNTILEDPSKVNLRNFILSEAEGAYYEEATQMYKDLIQKPTYSITDLLDGKREIVLVDMILPRVKDISAYEGLQIDTVGLAKENTFRVTLNGKGPYVIYAEDVLEQVIDSIKIFSELPVAKSGSLAKGLEFFFKKGDVPRKIFFRSITDNAIAFEKQSEDSRRIKINKKEVQHLSGRYEVLAIAEGFEEPILVENLELLGPAPTRLPLVLILSLLAFGLLGFLFFVWWRRKKQGPKTMFD